MFQWGGGGWGGWGGMITFMFLCTHRHSNLIIFLPVEQRQAQLFHDQLPVGWGELIRFMFLCLHTHSNLIIFLAVEHLHALLFHDQLPVSSTKCHTKAALEWVDLCEMSCERWVVSDKLCDLWDEMSCVRWVVWLVRWEELCEMKCVHCVRQLEWSWERKKQLRRIRRRRQGIQT